MDNPLLQNWWEGPHQGVPHFDQVQVKDFLPALERALQLYRKEISEIALHLQGANFVNTIEALEQSGQDLARWMAYYQVWKYSKHGTEFESVESQAEPALAAFNDEMFHNKKLFTRIQQLCDSKDFGILSYEQQRLLKDYRENFIQKGAHLSEAQKKQIAELNQRLSVLATDFSKNILKDEQDFLLIENEGDLAGLPPAVVAGAAADAARKGLAGKWLILNTRSAMEPFLTHAQNTSLRKKAYGMWLSRGDNGGASDNNKIASEILSLRLQRSRILGFSDFARWNLSNTMAKDPQKAMELMLQVWHPALLQAKKEIEQMEVLAGRKIEAWDYRYFAEKVRKQKYDFDYEELTPYLQLEKVRDSMFWVAEQLYGFQFVQLTDVPVFDPEVTVYKVIAEDEWVGLWYFDPFARPGKRSGAWMQAYREQQKMNGKIISTLVSNTSNFIQGKTGEICYISWEDAVTMYHEFGHALHGLNSNVTYPSLSGTNTLHDFMELPSQLTENWLGTVEVLARLTDKDNQPLPPSLIAKMKRAQHFNEGFATVEFLASAILDMQLHLKTEEVTDFKKIEAEALEALHMPSQIKMRHRIPHFSHIFSSEGYAAGYYAYLWAQVLEQDVFAAFTETGVFDKKLAQSLRDNIMSVGNSVEPGQAFRNFRGRDPEVTAFLRSRGFMADQ